MKPEVISRREEGAAIAYTILNNNVPEIQFRIYKYLLNRKGTFVHPVTVGLDFGIPYSIAAVWGGTQLRCLMRMGVVTAVVHPGINQPLLYGVPL
ncbi:hypothetical protein [Chitinophaga sp. sic0106]|uniref:hypothetical protein n=1 Tax=Chitinophaga sp. sic0106 TaxID=2854785 RepID=UPI001C461C5A|nr:hypothetical protein [Chitinophaga sp. sic0106]MBV7533746.1 hypothetical protein [Chitinophaga sp. sic0106]